MATAREIGKSLRDLLMRFGAAITSFINQPKDNGNTVTPAQIVAPYRARLNSIADGSFVMPKRPGQSSDHDVIEAEKEV